MKKEILEECSKEQKWLKPKNFIKNGQHKWLKIGKKLRWLKKEEFKDIKH